MYIYLDESYNLKDRDKPQFISINGFMIVPIKKVWKRWREYRRPFAGKWRIHAKVYEDMLKYLFARIQLNAYTSVSITIDNRKTKAGILGKQQLQQHLLTYLAEYYPRTKAMFNLVPSSSSILLEIADFISNTFYKQYIGQDIPLLQELSKIIVLKNPLK